MAIRRWTIQVIEHVDEGDSGLGADEMIEMIDNGFDLVGFEAISAEVEENVEENPSCS